MIDEVLMLLEDGHWHTVNELINHPSIKDWSYTKLQITLEFLAEYKFIEVNKRPGHNMKMMIIEAKIVPSLQDFLERMKEVERQEH